MALPRIISVDDHVVEPPSLWQDRLPTKFREDGPRVQRHVGRVVSHEGAAKLDESDHPDSAPVDVWHYEDLVWPLPRGYAQSGYEVESIERAVTYDDILPACHIKSERLAALDLNHTEASLTFPTFSRFCGQTFLEAKDRDLAKLCVEAYNDWMIDEWCAGDARGRLIPLIILPLWDAEMAAAEVRRCADKGAHALCFSEQPSHLGLPSIYTGHWDPLWQACEEVDTVVNMHIGSSSKMPVTSPDAPWELLMTINVENAINATMDWLVSGILERFKGLKIVLSESQVGWMPFFLDRLDKNWANSGIFTNLKDRMPNPPSSYIPGRVYGCIFDDLVGLSQRDTIGVGQIMFETDFPHADSTYPNSKKVAEELAVAAGLSDEETWKIVRGNAIECFGLERFGISG
jgi:predicted TIM-barrel fold metal-dependent hydrolase